MIEKCVTYMIMLFNGTPLASFPGHASRRSGLVSTVCACVHYSMISVLYVLRTDTLPVHCLFAYPLMYSCQEMNNEGSNFEPILMFFLPGRGLQSMISWID